MADPMDAEQRQERAQADRLLTTTEELEKDQTQIERVVEELQKAKE